MKSILIKSTIALGLGIASGPVLAQTEQPAQAQSGECPPGMECPQQDGAGEGRQPDVQGNAAPGEKQPDAGKGATAQSSPGEPQQQEAEAAQSQEGQTAPETQQQDQSGSEAAEQPSQGETDQQPSQEGAEQPAEGEPRQTQEGQAAGADVNVTVEQKTEITQVIREQNVEPIDVDFDVSVGVAVPETVKVKLLPLPQRIVKIVPTYEGYLFFTLADGRIIIVDPSTLQIVLIIA